MKNPSERMQTIGWIFFGLGFLIPFPLIYIYAFYFEKDPFDSALVIGLMVLFFGGSMVLLVGSTFVSLLFGRSKKVKNGPLVFGAVVSAGQTGLFINEQPQLEISLQFSTLDGQEIVASTREVVALTDLSEVQPGVVLPLRYDPAKPQKIVLDFDVDQESLQAALDMQMIASGDTTQEKVDIRNNGVKAQGVVLSSHPTGNIINGKGEIELHINVERPNFGGTFEVTVQKAVPQNSLSTVLPGSVIDVYYHPWDEQNIVIAFRFE